jgi:hypothetical protein
MTQDEFEKLRARLEEQLRLDVEMLYEAHRVKLRAFETIRRARAELEGSEMPPLSGAERPFVRTLQAPPPPQAPAPAVRTRGEAWSVLSGIAGALEALPEEFDKYDLVRALGEEPSKATLARALETLCKEKIIKLAKAGTGRTPARYRKLQGAAAAEPRDAAAAEPETGDGSRSAGTEPGDAAEPS